jgi:hypothetical protein
MSCESHSRQISQSTSSPPKLDVPAEPNSLKSGQIQMKLRRNNNQKTHTKTIKQTIEQMDQASETERRCKPLLLHDIK